MISLVVPMAGRSARFPGVKPKWMLTHPNGKFMALEALAGLDLSMTDKIYFVYLMEHEEQHRFYRGFLEELEEYGLHAKTVMVGLEKPTRDQPETVLHAIEKENIKGPIFIKDSDNRFSIDLKTGNYVCYYDLNEAGLIKPKNKSYILTDDFNRITNIIEKKVISPHFCVGGYSFELASLFTKSLSKLSTSQPRYISNVIYQCLLDDTAFEAMPVSDYDDWGTIEDWDRYKRSYASLFIDLDGVIVHHSASHFPPYYGDTEAIKENAEILRKLRESGKFQIIITTARHPKFRKVTEEQLERINIDYDELLMGMHHCKRIIINDYSSSNPFKSCDAINLKRNSQDLKEILREALGVDYDDI